MNTTTIELVPKEAISRYKFVNNDVLQTADERKMRQALLEKAMILGNGYKGKVKIVFETQEGTKAVETTVWQAGQDNIMLKGGINIPIRCIREVHI